VAKSPPDGYTIMMGHVSVNAIAPSLFSNLSYDVLKHFSPIALAAAVPHLVTVHPSLQVSSLKELVSYLSSQPGKRILAARALRQAARARRVER